VFTNLSVSGVIDTREKLLFSPNLVMNRLRKTKSLKAKERTQSKNSYMLARKQMELYVLLISKKDHKSNVTMLAATSTSGLRALATATRLMPGVSYVT
jgi:hypothetical protein